MDVGIAGRRSTLALSFTRRLGLPGLAGAVAAVPALAYVLLSPPSLDLPAHLLRAQLFSVEGFGLWDNWWYGGHPLPGYSVLFPPAAALLSPQLAAALAAVGTAVLFAWLVEGRPGAAPASVWFAAATATDLFTGRLTFAFGLLPAMGAVLALARRRPGAAAALAVLSALSSPVAAVMVAVAGAALALAASNVARRRWRRALQGAGVAAAALVPVLALALLFPEVGTEPFAFSVLWPVLLLCAAAFALVSARDPGLRAGVGVYATLCLLAYLIPTPLGSNAARLATLAAGPVAGLLLPGREWWLATCALPLLYLQWQAPVRDLALAAGAPEASASYYRPLLSFLSTRSGEPFRVEVPFTRLHWESLYVAERYPLARGWERQADRGLDGLFYDGRLTAERYRRWLQSLAVRYVALPDAPLDDSSRQEAELIRRPPPYLSPVFHSRHWRVYLVRDATPLVEGSARAEQLGAESVTLRASAPGWALVRVRWSPYWWLSGVRGCVAPAGAMTSLRLRTAGQARLVMRFSPWRARARAPRCN